MNNQQSTLRDLVGNHIYYLSQQDVKSNQQ